MPRTSGKPALSPSRGSVLSLSKGPAFVPPLLPTLVETPPALGEYVHEIKHDGFRTILVIERGKARAFSRNGQDWTARYPRLVRDAAKFGCRSAVLDGEAVAQDSVGRSSIEALYAALEGEPQKIVFFAFDLLHLDGSDLTAAPLAERKAALQKLIGERNPYSAVQFAEHFEGDARVLFGFADCMGLEGIVSKRTASRYKSGRSRDWLKTKCMTEGEFVVVGVEPNPGGAPFALLAREEGGTLAYAGSAFVTLPEAARERFWRRAEKLAVPKPVLAELRRNKATFLKPDMRVRARHLRGGDRLRHAALSALL